MQIIVLFYVLPKCLVKLRGATNRSVVIVCLVVTNQELYSHVIIAFSGDNVNVLRFSRLYSIKWKCSLVPRP